MKFTVKIFNKETHQFITQAFFPTLEASRKFANQMVKSSSIPAAAQIYELKEDLIESIASVAEKALPGQN